MIHTGCIDLITYEDSYMSVDLDGDDVMSLRLAKTSVRHENCTKLRVYEGLPWPKYSAGPGQGGNSAASEESKGPVPARPNQAAATSVKNANEVDAMIDEFGRMMGKDFSALKNTLHDNDISEFSELADLSDDDLAGLGFTMGLRMKLKKFLADSESSAGGGS